MTPFQAINATAGQLLADLRLIAAKHPRCKEWLGYGGQGAPCIDVLCDGKVLIFIMVDEQGSKHLTVNQVINKLSAFDPSLPVVLTYNYYYYNFEIHDGHFITYSETDESCLYDYNATDVRTPTEEQIQANNAQQLVDLGLSVQWATHNLGASIIEQYGDYYAWGELKPKSKYESSNYRFGQGEPYQKYQRPVSTVVKHLFRASETKTAGDSLTQLLPEDDAAQVKLGGTWRIPTGRECLELISRCSWTWGCIHGIYGYIVQSTVKGFTDRWIFLPASGFKINKGDATHCQAFAEYWASTVDSKDTKMAYTLSFPHLYSSSENNRDVYNSEVSRTARYSGHTIRPVCSKKM